MFICKNIILIGKSGATYTFSVHPHPVGFPLIEGIGIALKCTNRDNFKVITSMLLPEYQQDYSYKGATHLGILFQSSGQHDVLADLNC